MRSVIAPSLLLVVGLLLPSVSQSTSLGGATPQAQTEAEQKATARAATPSYQLSDTGLLAVTRRARCWRPPETARLNLREGPGGGGFQPNELVNCDYFHEPRSGTSPKFSCALAGGDVVKVRYGASNGEVEGSVLATRLLWALGFAADRV